MVAATVTTYPSSYPNMRYGSAVCVDGYTLDTGIESDNICFVAIAETADTVITHGTPSAAGVVTLALKTNGGAGTSQTIYWFAIKQPGGV